MKYNVVIRKTSSGMVAEKRHREEPPKELSDIAFATLSELEGESSGS